MADDNVQGTEETTSPSVVKPAPPLNQEPKSDSEKLIPLLGPLYKLLSSQKFAALLLVGIGGYILVLLDKVTLVNYGIFMMVQFPGWLLAHGIQDGLTKSKE